MSDTPDDDTTPVPTTPPKKSPWSRIATIVLFIVISLLIGIAGYYYLAKLNFVDSLMNASMILGGMGPIDLMPNNQSKVFASFYAIYCGVVFLVLIAFLIDTLVN